MGSESSALSAWVLFLVKPVIIIKIYHECESRIEKSVPRITDWHHEAGRVMTSSDPEGQIYLSHTHTKNGIFFLLPIDFLS